MGDIERSTRMECPEHGTNLGESTVFFSERRCQCGQMAKPVEYAIVPLADWRGAVDALRWALGFIEYQGEPSPLDDPREGHEDAESHRRVQAIVGGQSS